MIINKENYEQFAIDYLDGRLSKEMHQKMEQFLAKNPDIRADLDMLQLFVVKADDSVKFAGKEKLYQPIGNFSASAKWLLPLLLLFGIAFTSLFFYINWNSTDNNQYLSIEKEKPAISNEFTENGDVVLPVVADSTKMEVPAEKPITTATSPAKATNTKGNTTPKKEVEPQIVPLPTPVVPKVMEVDSSRLKITPPQPARKPIAMPMATIGVEKVLNLEHNQINVLPEKELALALALNNGLQKPSAARGSKKIKTPFGNFQLEDLRNAFLPESYIASK